MSTLPNDDMDRSLLGLDGANMMGNAAQNNADTSLIDLAGEMVEPMPTQDDNIVQEY